MILSRIYKTQKELERIVKNLHKQGKSDEEVKQAIICYLQESKRKMNPNGDLDII